MAESKKAGGPTAATATTGASLPRVWLVAILTVTIVPWIVVGLLYAGAFRRDPTRAGPDPVPASARAPGPWGTLAVTPIRISPPLEYVSTDWGRQGPASWSFPGVSLDRLESLLASTGLDAGTAARVRATARPEPRIEGVVASPGDDLIRALDPDVRSRLYMLLGKLPLNADQAHSYRFFGASAEAWLGGSPISSRTRELVEPLLYRDGEFLHFADLALVRARISDVEEVRRLAKTLLRQATLIVRLTVDVEEVPDLTEYWGRGGRKTDLRPLLESVAGSGPDNSIDIVHLLPALARTFLYRYPKLTAADYDRPVIANCFWTALNFFLPQPDDRFLDVAYALARLKTDYYIVQAGFQLGDIIAFLDADDRIFHVVVHLADNLVLTKNGVSPMAPWIILPLEQVKGFYRTRSAEARLIYHRRKDL